MGPHYVLYSWCRKDCVSPSWNLPPLKSDLNINYVKEWCIHRSWIFSCRSRYPQASLKINWIWGGDGGLQGQKIEGVDDRPSLVNCYIQRKSISGLCRSSLFLASLCSKLKSKCEKPSFKPVWFLRLRLPGCWLKLWAGQLGSLPARAWPRPPGAYPAQSTHGPALCYAGDTRCREEKV